MPCDCKGMESFTEDKLRKELTAVTRVACDLRTILRRGGNESDLCPETRAWIAEHDAWDAERIAQEQARGERQRVKQAALDKLSLDERRVLGL
jgi:hypothetical protein